MKSRRVSGQIVDTQNFASLQSVPKHPIPLRTPIRPPHRWLVPDPDVRGDPPGAHAEEGQQSSPTVILEIHDVEVAVVIEVADPRCGENVLETFRLIDDVHRAPAEVDGDQLVLYFRN